MVVTETVEENGKRESARPAAGDPREKPALIGAAQEGDAQMVFLPQAKCVAIELTRAGWRPRCV